MQEGDKQLNPSKAFPYLCAVNKISSRQIFSISSPTEFERFSLEIFHFQAAECSLYADYINRLGIVPESVKTLKDIPFLPIEFFKSHSIISSKADPEITFSSSSTGGSPSMHQVTDLSLYKYSFTEGFKRFYGPVNSYAVLALLPSYLERKGSSLIYMVDDLIRESESPYSGYFLFNHDELRKTLSELKKSARPTILIGVTYALLDFTDNYKIDFPELIVMETGGMKGKRKEMVREDLHEILCKGFGVSEIHSEYGMTELLSQAYSKSSGIFECPPWMQVTTRDINDPLSLLAQGQTGGLNVIDLANLNSCSFIATQDLGKQYSNGNFEVLGRFDNSDIRGCNLLVQ